MRIQNTAAGSLAGLWRKGIIIGVLSLLATSSLFAQAGGTVAGRVINQGTEVYLEGARIQVEGTNLVTYSDRGGEFRIGNVPSGSRTLLVSYTGLDSARVPVSVSPSETVNREISLTSDVYKLDEVSVVGLREGSALALTLQRKAANVMNVAAIDQFGAPAANPGELLQRLPGVAADPVGAEIRQIRIRGLPPEASSIMIDGNRTTGSDSASVHRWVPVDSLATYNLERVELVKAPTPDMDADAIGGFVNLVSKRAFDRAPGRYITFSAGSIFNDRPGDSPESDAAGLDMLALGYSEVFSVFGGENNLGVSVNAGYRKSYTLADQQWHTYARSGQTAESPVAQNLLQSREFVAPTYRPSLGASIDYKVSDETALTLKLDANRKQSYQVYRGWTWSGGAPVANYAPGYSYDYSEHLPNNNSRYTIYSGDITAMNYNYTLTTKVDHDWGDLKLQWGGFYSFTSAWYPTTSTLTAEIRGNGFAIDRSDPNQHDWYPDLVQLSGPSIYDADNYTAADLSLSRNSSQNTIWGLNADLRKDFNLAVPAFVKGGLRIRNDANVRDWATSVFRYVGPDRISGTADDKNLSQFVQPQYSYGTQRGRYDPVPAFAVPGSGNTGDIQKLLDEHPEYFDQNYYTTIRDEHDADGEVDERVSAAYMMGNVDVGRLSILAGVRVEQTEIDALGPVNTPTSRPLGNDDLEIAKGNAEWPGTFEPRTAEYRKVFPGLHFRYEAFPGLVTRASWSTGVSRAHKNNFISALTVNDVNQTVSIPNPGLEPQFSDNFDISFEYYFEPVGLFSVGGFLKEMENFTFTETFDIGSGANNGFGGEYAGYEARQVRNGGSARIRGIEVNFEQQFTWLPGFWSAFGLSANYTRLSTKGDYGGTRVLTAIPSFTPETANMGISYVDHGFSVRFLGTYRGRRLQTNSTNPALLQWLNSRTWYDVKFQYTVNRNLDLYVDVINIFDEPSQEVEYGYGLARWRFLEGTQYNIGLRGRF